MNGQGIIKRQGFPRDKQQGDTGLLNRELSGSRETLPQNGHTVHPKNHIHALDTNKNQYGLNILHFYYSFNGAIRVSDSVSKGNWIVKKKRDAIITS